MLTKPNPQRLSNANLAHTSLYLICRAVWAVWPAQAGGWRIYAIKYTNMAKHAGGGAGKQG